jgi:hypothetical protein
LLSRCLAHAPPARPCAPQTQPTHLIDNHLDVLRQHAITARFVGLLAGDLKHCKFLHFRSNVQWSIYYYTCVVYEVHQLPVTDAT